MTITGVDNIDLLGRRPRGRARRRSAACSARRSTSCSRTSSRALQNGDRFYYLSRTAGLNFGTELENNTFAQLVMLNSDATHLPAAIFSDADIHPRGRSDARSTPAWASAVAPIRPAASPINGVEVDAAGHPRQPGDTVGPDANYLQYTGARPRRARRHRRATTSSSSGDRRRHASTATAATTASKAVSATTTLFGGDGDDIITDIGGDRRHPRRRRQRRHYRRPFAAALEVRQHHPGRRRQDFIATVDDISTIFGGRGDDFIYGSKTELCRKPATRATTGSSWARRTARPATTFSPFLADDVLGNDIFVGGGGF